MVREPANTDHLDMATRTDGKLDSIAAGLAHLRPAEVRELGRLGDLVSVDGGTVLVHEGGHEPWSYCVVRGAALLSHDDAPVAVAGAGSWVLGRVQGERMQPARLQVIAGDALEVLAFRPADVEAVLRSYAGR